MGPVGHAAVAYLVWTGVTHVWGDRAPSVPEFWVVVVGSQFPDLVDKPLAWTVPILPSGRSLGHSLVTIAVLLAVLHRIVPDDRRNLLAALGVTLVGHSLGDAVIPITEGRYAYVRFLLWPLVSQPPYDTDRSILQQLLSGVPTEVLGLQTLLAALVLTVWLVDGRPGLPSR